jgi:hypothetical protein
MEFLTNLLGNSVFQLVALEIIVIIIIKLDKSNKLLGLLKMVVEKLESKKD